jgi:hypothetical protein
VRPEQPEPLRPGAAIRISSATELLLVSAEDAEMPDLTGAVLDGRYTLIRLMRTTGKGALYEANDARLPHRVAIKALSPALAGYPGYLVLRVRPAVPEWSPSHEFYLRGGIERSSV